MYFPEIVAILPEIWWALRLVWFDEIFPVVFTADRVSKVFPMHLHIKTGAGHGQFVLGRSSFISSLPEAKKRFLCGTLNSLNTSTQIPKLLQVSEAQVLLSG